MQGGLIPESRADDTAYASARSGNREAGPRLKEFFLGLRKTECTRRLSLEINDSTHRPRKSLSAALKDGIQGSLIPEPSVQTFYTGARAGTWRQGREGGDTLWKRNGGVGTPPKRSDRGR